MSAFRTSGGRNALLVVAAISIILMMGALPIATAFTSSEDAYTALFYRDSSGTCSDLGTNIQARFEWDISGGTNNTNTMAINEVGNETGIAKNDVFGAFKFDEFPLGLEYLVDGNPYYPGVESYANFRNYSIFSVNMTVTEPSAGFGAATVTHSISSAVTYDANFSTAKDQFRIAITQTTTDIETYYYIISSSGTVLQTWTLDQSLSGVTLAPPYAHYVVSDEIDGLENQGYAIVKSGTDFQIESVIQPSTAIDFIGHQTPATYTGGNNAISVSCTGGFNSFCDEEGDDATYTYENYYHSTSSNEAYQWIEVT
jgi:hypothetical protein